MNNPLANPKKAAAAQNAPAYTTDISQPLTSGKGKPKAASQEEEKKEEEEGADSNEDENDSNQEEESKTTSSSK